jgi:hypothetical protein
MSPRECHRIAAISREEGEFTVLVLSDDLREITLSRDLLCSAGEGNPMRITVSRGAEAIEGLGNG